MSAADTGLEFPDGTLTRGGIERLARVRWDEHGLLLLFGCNTGVPHIGTRWVPAQEFATRQGVTTLGQPGWADFSERKERYVRIDGRPGGVYLEAFWQGSNMVPSILLHQAASSFLPTEVENRVSLLLVDALIAKIPGHRLPMRVFRPATGGAGR